MHARSQEAFMRRNTNNVDDYVLSNLMASVRYVSVSFKLLFSFFSPQT